MLLMVSSVPEAGLKFFIMKLMIKICSLYCYTHLV